MDRLQLLKNINFGSQVAEDEISSLQDYFVATDQWSRIERGEVDLVRGEKGAGKSAIYLLLEKRRDNFFDQNVVIVSGENPRGATVFKDLISDPPASEREFIVLWKLYILSIVAHEMRSYGISEAPASEVYAALEDAKLLDRVMNLAGLLRSAQSFARRLLGIKAIEGGLEIDPNTGATGIVGKISLQEPTTELRSSGINSIDGMFEKLNRSLDLSNFTVWVLLDRLDVAFADSHELEANAIRALVRAYGDLRSFNRLSLKIFLREDIWKRVTESGFREASHVIRFVVMGWSTPMLLNLLMRRLLNNPAFVESFAINKDEILNNADQQVALFRRVFPEQVEQGSRKAATFDWMVARCADATGNTAPREMIHLLNSLREEEIRRLERGENVAPGDQIFDRSVFKLALPRVSETRLNTYLYAEYPEERPSIEKLVGEKTEQTPESLAEIWGVSRDDAIQKAQILVKLGFFQVRGTRQEPTYWVPFLYRDALKMVQGKAGAASTDAEENDD
ncbi:hypothetical protein HA463_24600 [Rhizobium leguminosarum bv. trifolii]|nr:hypothetical protein HA463_24600 [Rhizobium leguminosarum bv. trifolii]